MSEGVSIEKVRKTKATVLIRQFVTNESVVS